jgi:hypothetical protein
LASSATYQIYQSKKIGNKKLYELKQSFELLNYCFHFQPFKAGNPTATIIALASLRDFELEDKFVQMAIKDSGGLEVLLNILETDENRCKRASLMVIKEITSSPEISRSIFNMRVSLKIILGSGMLPVFPSTEIFIFYSS